MAVTVTPERDVVATPIQRALREAFYAGAISLGLFVLFIGLKTDQNISNELILVQRWGLLAAVVILTAVGRFLYVGFAQPAMERAKAEKAQAPAAAVTAPGFLRRNFNKIGVAVLLVYPIVIVLLVGFQGSLKWVDNFGIQILIYVMLAWGLNIVVGLAGLLDLGYVAFYAVGAYSYTLLATTFALSFWVLLPVAGFLAAMWGIILGFPVLRLRGDYLAIVTLGFGEIIRVIIINWQSLTGGPNGLDQIARPGLFGLSFLPGGGSDTFAGFFGLGFSPTQRIVFLYYVILALALATVFFVQRIRRLPLGRAWEALREDEIACRSLGINPTTIKLAAFAIGAGCAGFAGSFFATRQGFISPESFTFIESAIILAIVVLGGMGSQSGLVIGALLLIGLPEWFRSLAEYRMLVFGALMVLIMIWRPRGLLSFRDPTITLARARAGPIARPKEP